MRVRHRQRPEGTLPEPLHGGLPLLREAPRLPEYSVVVQRWVAGCQRNGLPLDAQELMAYIRAEHPYASYQQPKVHDFQKFVASFLNLSDPGDVAAVVE